jgi:plasmid stabilization system protein ParE
VNEIFVSPAAEAEIDDIWLYVARESHSIEIASRVVDGITAKFWTVVSPVISFRAAPAILSPVLTPARATIYVFPSHSHVAEY